jgi:3-oxoadipate enol-lactonase
MPWHSIHGVDLYYEITGNGSPVVLIHGLGSSLLDWENQVPSISAQYQVIAFDLRGYGRSARHTGPYTINQFTKDTAGLIKSLGPAPVHVVGLSLGGMVALQLSLDYPELVNKLVIVNSLPEVKLSSFRARWEIGLRFLLTRLFGMRITGLVLSRRVFPNPQQRDLRKKFAARWAGNDPQVYMSSVRGLLGWSVQERLSSIPCPTLVVAGEKDFLPLAEKEHFTKNIPEAEMAVITGSGHASPVDHPEEFNRIVLEFLSRGG